MADTGFRDGKGRASSTMFGTGGPVTVSVAINSDIDVGGARRAANKMGIDAGMSETEAGSLALVVTEAARNIARYGRAGSVMLRSVNGNRQPMIEMIAIDSGPGLPDVAKAMTDGYSTGGTPGKGLGAMKRLSSEFDIWSSKQAGTVIVARFAISSRQVDDDVAGIGIVCTALKGEAECGDAWMVERSGSGVLAAVIDGLGHGPEAAVAADTAVDIIRRKKNSTLDEIMRAAHDALRSTRGAAVQIAIIDAIAGTLRSAGIGNISASINTRDGMKIIPAQPGIVGHQMSRVREVTLPWSTDSLLTMHSDGVSGRWRFETYPGLRLRDPAISAAVIHRDFARGRDDATIMMLRTGGEAREALST